MLGRIRNRRPSYASVIATIALTLAVGMGGAYAADKIGSRDVAKGAVKSKHVKNNALTGKDVTETSFGQVPSAARADRSDRAAAADTAVEASHAAAADEATRAEIAASANTAANANALGGKPASAFMTDLEVVRAESPSNSNPTRNVTAECPAGKKVIGGGSAVLFGGAESVALAADFPPRTPAEDWNASAWEIAATAQNWAVEAVAYCARIGG